MAQSSLGSWQNGLKILRQRGILAFIQALLRKSAFLGNIFTFFAERLAKARLSEFFISISPIVVSQLHETRGEIMVRVLKECFSSPIKALEVGTWFGHGSTKLWVENIPDGSEL